MKDLLAMLFSIALLASQATFVTGAGDFEIRTAAAPSCCCNCRHCNGRCCCANQNGPDSSHSTPAVPARGVSQHDWQLLAAMTVEPVQQAARKPLTFSAPVRSDFSVSAPLYQRHCSYIL
jgi:hypothetical protein